MLASGLLTEKIGGPSVRPPQPAAESPKIAYGSPAWNASEGPDRFRRSLYTFSKRAAPFALYNTFDAPVGEACVVRRDRSDTPLQALALLERRRLPGSRPRPGLRDSAAQPGPVEERIGKLYRRCLTRPPEADEIRLLAGFFTAQRERFERGELSAKAIAGDGLGDLNERAAWTVLIRAIFNLDESVTRS